MDQLLSNYKNHHSDLLLNLKTIESDVHAFLNYISSAISECKASHSETRDELHRQLREMDIIVEEQKLMIYNQSKMMDQTAKATAANIKLIAELESKVKYLEDENCNFRKVSRIIAFENENARLKVEMESLKKRLIQKDEKSIEDQIQELNSDIVEKIMSSDSEDGGGEDDEDEALDLYEKKIKGTVYYITNDDARRLFEKMSDGSVGKEIGKLEGKSTIVLINCQI